MPYLLRGRYMLEALESQGSMGSVFRARALDDRKVCAIKLMRNDQNPTFRGQVRPLFEREHAAAALLGDHSGFVKVYAFDRSGPQPFLEMEYVSAPTLRARLDKPLPEAVAARIGASLAQSLAFMHQLNMVHRDVKPSNVFVYEQGDRITTKLADFGCWVFDRRSPASTDSPRESIGTLPYMAPEQMHTGEVTTAADLFSLGSILWEMVTGAPPFPVGLGDQRCQIEMRARACLVVPPRPTRMSEPFYRIAATLLAHAPEQRGTARDAHEALLSLAVKVDDAQTALLEAPSEAPMSPQPRRPILSSIPQTLWLLIGMLVGFALCVVAVAMLRPDAPAPASAQPAPPADSRVEPTHDPVPTIEPLEAPN